MKKVGLYSAISLLAVSVSVSGVAAAQSVSPEANTSPVSSAAPTTEGSPAGQLGEIVVTAQRRSENLQRAAVAVTAVTGDTLKLAGVTNPTQLTSIVPALQVSTAAGPYNLFYLRGVGNFNSNAFSDSAIAFNMDGVFVGRPSSTTGFFYDLERVEVVKGPQGTLYGRNATGGAINVISHKPDLGKFEVNISAEYGNYDALRIDGAVNIPIGDRAAFRIAGIRVKHDGYMNNDMDDQDDWGTRASLRVDPTDTLKIVVSADYFNQGGNGVGSTPRLAANGVATPSTLKVDDRIDLLSPEGQAFLTSQPNGTLGRNFAAIPLPQAQPFLDNKYWGISSTIDWKTPVGTLTVIPAYREARLNYGSFTPGFYVREKSKSDQKSVEARFATTDDFPLRALLGGFYYKENTNDPFSIVNTQNYAYYRSETLSTESKALFGRLTYAVTHDFRLSVGARQTWEDKSFDGSLRGITRICLAATCPSAPPIPYNTTPPAVPVVVPTFGTPPYGGIISFNPDSSPSLIQTEGTIATNDDRKFKKFTWRAGADWDVTPRNLIYASYETGFKAGGFYYSADNPATPNKEGVYRPETISAFTIGSKNRFLNNRVQVNLELFRWRYKGQQIAHLGIDTQGNIIFPIENVGKGTFQGFELETRFAATATTTLTADLQYLDAKYNSFVYTTPNLNGGAFNGTGCPNAGTPGQVYTVNCSGKRPPNAPKWTLNLGGQQTIPLGSGNLVFDARAHYQSKSLTGVEFLPIEDQRAYWLVDGALTYYSPGRRYSIGVFANNIFNKTVISNTFPTPFSNFYSSTLRPPRTFGVRAGANF